MRVLCLLALLLPVSACQQAGGPHYVVGKPYEMGGVWRYPHESFSGAETGLATVFRGRTPTADGEAWSDGAMLAASPTMQLPAVVRVTNLQNGLQAVLRVNDRGPANPGRLIGVSPRVAFLLGAPGSTAFEVRVEVLEQPSQALAATLQGKAATVAVKAAPAAAVTAQSLAPPPGAQGGAQGSAMADSTGAAPGAAPSGKGSLFSTGPGFPLRPPEVLTRTAAEPGRLYVDCGGVSNPDYAMLLAARLSAYGARAVPDYSYPPEQAFRARVGPLGNVAAADAMLDRLLRAGIANARIVVE
jgi:rare lipoprotein A